MPDFEEAGPFSDAPIEDVRLERAPLVRVLVQLRFPGALGVLLGEDPVSRFAGPFAEAGYPLVESGNQFNLEITPQGIRNRPGGALWTLSSRDRDWQVALTPEFVTLSAGNYTYRDDFLDRLVRVVEVLRSTIDVPSVNRVGYRYINRLVGLPQDEIRPLVREAFHAGIAVPPGTARLHGGISEATFSLDPDSSALGVRDGLVARWGQLQPRSVLDPSIPAVDAPSWVLDIDAFRHSGVEFESEAIAAEVREMSVRAYRFFRWAVTPAFLSKYRDQ